MNVARTSGPVLVLVLSACGADVVHGITGDGGDVPPPPDLQNAAGCPRLLPVPEGDAWIGFFKLDKDTFTLERISCDDPQWGEVMTTKRLNVPSFYLDEDAVTNGCYTHCVDEGACLDPPPMEEGPNWRTPGIFDFPVTATGQSSEAYCEWRGGRLPSAAELARASHGDNPNVTTGVAYAVMVACWEQDDPLFSDCQYVFDRARVEARPGPVREDPRDVGPFGHWDLFGSRSEITQTYAPSSQDGDYCTLPDGAADPRTFNAEADTWRLSFAPARSLMNAVPATGQALLSSSLSVATGSKPELYGVRCAYDPVKR